MRILLTALIAAVALSSTASAQYVSTKRNTAKTQSQTAYRAVEQMPTFPGGDAALMKWIKSHLQYPKSAAQENIQGTVVVQFVVTSTGSIGDVRVVRSFDDEFDREAIRLCKSLPKFVPGRHNGKPVSVWYTLPVTFRLSGTR